MTAHSASTYPVQFNVDYPEGALNRLSSFFRIVYAIPILIVAALLTSARGNDSAGGVIALPAGVMLLFRRKYPRWWFDWNLQFVRFQSRILAYLVLLTDEYPSTDEEQRVHLQIAPPDATQLNRWLPLVKWLLALPHYVVLFVLTFAAVLAVIVAWFAILFSGSYPRALFDFVVGVIRWWNRVLAYAFLLTTDEYPPFSLNE